MAAFQPRSLDIDVVGDLMIHDIDAVLHLTGHTPSDLSAVGVAVLSSTEDIANARLEFADGCVANLTASRVSVEYEYTLDAYHRNLALASAGWQGGPWWLGTTWVSESDDRGRPITGTLDESDQIVLAAAGDSAN